jgi:hypothetical protein
MNSGLKPRKRDRLSSLFGKREQSPSSSQTVQSCQPLPQNTTPGGEAYGDTSRARDRYVDAAKLLQKAVTGCGDQWKIFDFPEMRGEPEDFNDVQFRGKINAILAKQRDKVKNRNAWGKFEYGIQRVFATFSPFAKNFLTIAKEGQQVMSSYSVHAYPEQILVLNPYGLLCGGLFLLITVLS